MVIRLQIFTVKKFQRWTLNHSCLSVISLNSALKDNENVYLQLFFEKCKYIEKIVVRYISDNLSKFSK